MPGRALPPGARHPHGSEQGPQLIFACDPRPAQGLTHGGISPSGQGMNNSILRHALCTHFLCSMSRRTQYAIKIHFGVPSSAGHWEDWGD